MSCATWLGRFISRAFFTGVQGHFGPQSICSALVTFRFGSKARHIHTNGKLPIEPELSTITDKNHNSFISPAILGLSQDNSFGPGVVSVVSGIPKDFSSSTFRRGQFGEDAWFIARSKSADVLGVADGVGGWRSYGIDSGVFSFTLMKACELLVEAGWFSPKKPGRLLATGFSKLQEKNTIQGSSTACVLALNREDAILYSANLGDSGFIVLRNGVIIHRSKEQTHSFNTPFQLSCPPKTERELSISDSADSADISQLAVQDGDVILLATDGLFDNLPENLLVTELTRVEGVKDLCTLQKTANAICLMARTLAFNSSYMSPFSKNARKNGIDAIGGKPDDITILLAIVNI